ncbi:type II toxin-antitoxin system HicA family toxin [Geminocystis sp. CENA526]|uniref:type II toxin-antitoxin system HicA family toxin n=1 Tax=unclassified Geminocystis TaxID=2625037 RepID=UPI0027E2D9BB|nr:type II toxin-antitoxin system HicA family toxin [Geminocystis sp. GBBB08]MBL1209123.1 type II toxin-antitoxin system HicA family toxin [Geminocystis sp. GBBB08]
MPKKVRELKKMLLKAGFTYRQGKGSHTFWTHPLILDEPITISGKDSDDARLYLEKAVEKRLKKLEELK